MELHLCEFDYTKYPLEEMEKLYEYLFGEATGFCDHIEAERKFLEAIKNLTAISKNSFGGLSYGKKHNIKKNSVHCWGGIVLHFRNNSCL